MNIDILSTNSVATTFKANEVPEHISLKQSRASGTRNLGGEDLILTSLSIAAGVPVGIFVNWLWTKLHEPHVQPKDIRKFTLDYKEIEIHRLKKSEFLKIFEYKISIKR